MQCGKNNQFQEQEVLTCAEVAQELSTSTQTIRLWILLGKIDPKGCFKIGKHGRWRIYRSAVEKARIYARSQVNGRKHFIKRNTWRTLVNGHVLHNHLDAVPSSTGELDMMASFWKCIYVSRNRCSLKNLDAGKCKCTNCVDFDHNGID